MGGRREAALSEGGRQVSNDPIVFMFDPACWLFGFRFSRHEIGLCFGPLSVSIMPSKFAERRR